MKATIPKYDKVHGHTVRVGCPVCGDNNCPEWIGWMMMRVAKLIGKAVKKMQSK